MKNQHTILSLVLAMLISVISCIAQTNETSLERHKNNKPKVRKHIPKTNSPKLILRLFKQIDETTKQETNPYTVFHPGDQIQMSLSANQSGYLYIIHQDEKLNGILIYPDSQIDHGQNFIEKNKEIIIPSLCNSNTDECWWTLTPSPDEKEHFMILFSPTIIQSVVSQTVENGGTITREALEDLKKRLDNSNRPNQFDVNSAGSYKILITGNGKTATLIQSLTLINQNNINKSENSTAKIKE